ncbi:MAG TPA: 50S ribosomal protein L11 methyltransferase [Polyangia bacterium]
MRDGFGADNVARWYGAPILVTDAQYVPAPADRPRRGLGAWMALWVAGETVARADLAPAASAEELAALAALGLVDDDGGRLVPRVRVLPWRGLVVASPPREVFDVSALNVAASLPAGGSVWDVGCGAGLLSLVAAKSGARVFGSDVDGELVDWARLNAALNGVDAEFAVGDLFAGDERICDVVAFNAPLLRAPLAVADEAPRYTSTPEGEALALRFLDGVHARARVLLHAQLTPAVAAALDGWAARAAVGTVVFAHAPDGTPHALTEIRVDAAPARRSIYVPLSPACPHLSRAIFDALSASRALADDVTPLPAPWLELRTRERFDGGRRALGVSFGGVPVDADDVALLDRLRGEPLGALALSSIARERLCVMIDRGHVILR